MHPTEKRTKDRERRREKDRLTEQWHDDTQSQDTEILRHPFHDDMLMYYSLLVSNFKDSFAPPSSATTTLRSGFTNFDRAMMSSSVHPLRYRWSGQKIHSLTLCVMHPNVCSYSGKKKKSGQHTLDRPSFPLNWISSVVLQFTIDSQKFVWWHCQDPWQEIDLDAPSAWKRKKKRRLVIVISVTEHDQETIIPRRDYAAVCFLDMSRLKVDLWSVFD